MTSAVIGTRRKGADEVVPELVVAASKQAFLHGAFDHLILPLADGQSAAEELPKVDTRGRNVGSRVGGGCSVGSRVGACCC